MLLVGALSPSAAGASLQPQVVVAVADSGVNPYHEMYYRPDNTAHPCTWVEGFDDCSVPALDLSIGEYDTYEEAVAADDGVWRSVTLHQWYWIPRTNIIGAVCEGSGTPTTTVGVCILDDHGHGTGTTSSVLTEAPDALLLVHEGNSGAEDLATAPVVPDIQTHSWVPAVPLPLHAADPLFPGDSWFCGDSAFHDPTIFFIAAGNEAPFPSIADCRRVNNRVQVVGGAFPGYATLVSWSTYDFASWWCRPTARHTSITEMRPEYCGSSFSSPTAAGAAADALLDIRRQEGYTGRSTGDMVSTTVTRDAFIQALRSAATYTPESKFPNTPGVLDPSVPLPQEAPYLFWGYGWLDGTVSDVVVSCALGRECPVKSAEAQEYNARRRELRSATSEDAAPPPPQDDAGGGRDAGSTRATAVPVQPGGPYDARLEPTFFAGDTTDWFTFTAAAGHRIDVSLTGLLYCWRLLDPLGEVLADGCPVPAEGGVQNVTAPVGGQYALVVLAQRDLGWPPQDYRFSIDLVAPT